MINAAILSIGDELALGQTVDTNAAWLAARLAERGIGTLKHLTIADDRDAIADGIRYVTEQVDLVISTGGLGPTEDDLTRFALADVMDSELQIDANAETEIRAFFDQRGRVMAERNRVQALCPVGATMLSNSAGTAPGLFVEREQTQLFFFPGVPREMKVMFEQHVLPALPIQTGRVILTTKINTFGSGESDIAEKLGELMDRKRNPLVGTTVSDGIVAARIRSEFDSLEAARAHLDETILAVSDRLGSLVFGRDEMTVAEAVANLLVEKNRSLATAESCTGGLISTLVTDIPGSSAYYRGGWVTYANEMKQAQLDVPSDLLTTHGAVSEPIAIAMAEAALLKSNADLAIATTGIAGPSGGTAEKPLGLVWFALAQRGQATITHRHIFPGDRRHIRHRAALTALNLIRLQLLAE